MAKKARALNTWARILFILVFLISLAVFWTLKSGDGWMDFILNCVFDCAAAIVLIAYFAGCAKPLRKTVAGLDDAACTIRNHAAAADPKTLWAEMSQQKLFAGTALAGAYQAYVKQVKRESRSNPATADCDIADYINEEALYTVVRKHYCDQISGIMTGLGILFTFIGLVYGLRGFDATTVELMQESTRVLMAGIKVAFLTSIFGLIYSLLFTLFYKRLIQLSEQTLDEFLDSFDECVRPSNAHAGENTLITLQAEQNALLQNYASNVGQAVSETLSAGIGPVVEKLGRTLESYVTVAMEDQKSAMERVVVKFFESMDTAMGNIFTQLREQTAELSQWQKNMTLAIQKLLEGVGQAEADLETSRKYTQLTIEKVETFAANADTLVSRQLESLRTIENFMNDYQALHKAEKAYIMDMAAAAKSAEDSAAKNVAAVEEVNRLSIAYTDALEQKVAETLGRLSAQVATMGEDQRSSADLTHRQLESAGARMEEASDSLKAVAEKSGQELTAASEKLTTAMNGSFDRFDTQLSALSQTLNGLCEASDKVSRSMAGLPTAAKTFDSEIGQSAKALKTELSNLLSALTDTRKALEKFNSSASRKLNG